MPRAFAKYSPFALSIALGLALSFAWSSPSWAQATFGAEFNFSNKKLQNSGVNAFTVSQASEEARDRMMEEVKRVCGGCTIESKINGHGITFYRILYSDGWYFNIATDPGVVEVQTKPSDLATIEKFKTRMQEHIFDTAKKAGLLPAGQIAGQDWAGSHIHIGAVSALGTGPQAVRFLKNFMVDFSNHSELALGIFTNDSMNAPALVLLPETEKNHLKEIAAEVDEGKIKDIAVFARRVREEVYNKTIAKVSPSTKYQAFNLNRIGNEEFPLEEQTFELRAMRGQDSAEDFALLTRLLDGRLKYVESRVSSIPLHLRKNMNAEEMAEAFHSYVLESGLRFGPYEKFLAARQKKYLPAIQRRMGERACKNVFSN